MMPKTSRICEYCGTSYSKKEHFDRHVRTHTREKPFNCAQCSSKFSRRDALQRHIRICHPNEDETSTATPGIVDTNVLDLSQPQRPLPSAERSDGLDDLFHHANDDHTGQSPPTLFAHDLGWQWDDALNLDATFSIDDLCTFDPNIANVSTPWLPLLRSSGELNVTPIAPSSTPLNSLPRPQGSPQWFTHMVHPTLHPSAGPSRCRTPTAMDDAGISRDALASSLVLQQPASNTILPDTRFLNRCIHTFTTRLWPAIPVVHLPTFQPAQTNPLLLLSICSLGALADGSKQALYHAERLFEGVQKAILVSFSPGRNLDKHTLAALQAAAIGQTFALLSGKAEHLIIAQAFHSTLFIVTRKSHALLSESRFSLDPTPNSLQATDWDEWITAQTIIRLLNALYVHNGEVSAITQQPAFHRTQPLCIPVAAHDSLYLAKTAHEWIALQHSHSAVSLPSRSNFSSCAVLECFVGEISHSRCYTFDVMNDQYIDGFQNALHAWFLESAESFRADRVQRLTILSLWHSCFLLLLCDFDLVEKACGRDGDSIAIVKKQELRAWILTPRAKQCISHAALLCRLTDEMRVSDVPAVHLARSLWHAGLLLAAYASLAQADLSLDVSSTTTEGYPGIETLHQAHFLSEHALNVIKDDATPSQYGMLASAVSTTLRHLGPWPVAAYYATTLDQVLDLGESC